jgi:exonuclease VII large subunit
VVKAVTAYIKPQAGTDEKASGQTAAGQSIQPAVEDKKEQKLADTRQNLARISQEIVKARQERIKKYQQSLQVKDKEKEKKVAEKQEKKKEESVLMKLIKGKSGTREGIQRAGG